MNNLQLPGQRINRTDTLSNLLVRAAKTGDLEVVNDLLTRGIDLNAPDTDGSTALSGAVLNGHTGVVKALLGGGVRPDKSRVLIQASAGGFLEIVKLLLAHQADPNITGGFGKTALYNAAEHGFLDIANVLLDKGADPNKADHSGFTALNQAVCFGHADMVKALLVRGAQHAKARDVLWHAATSGSLAVVKELLAQGARPDVCPNALVAAVEVGDKEIVTVLLANGADPNTPNMFGHVALDQAFHQKHCEMVNILLDGNAKPSPLTLTEAAGLGYTETVQKLLDLGVDPNTRAKKHHTTSLCQAAKCGCPEV